MLAQVYETSLVLDELQDQRLTIHHIFVFKYLFDSYYLSCRLYLSLRITKMGRKIGLATDIFTQKFHWKELSQRCLLRDDLSRLTYFIDFPEGPTAKDLQEAVLVELASHLLCCHNAWLPRRCCIYGQKWWIAYHALRFIFVISWWLHPLSSLCVDFVDLIGLLLSLSLNFLHLKDTFFACLQLSGYLRLLANFTNKISSLYLDDNF